jgi:hypothetical protein
MSKQENDSTKFVNQFNPNHLPDAPGGKEDIQRNQWNNTNQNNEGNGNNNSYTNEYKKPNNNNYGSYEITPPRYA